MEPHPCRPGACSAPWGAAGSLGAMMAKGMLWALARPGEGEWGSWGAQQVTELSGWNPGLGGSKERRRLGCGVFLRKHIVSPKE